MHRVRWIIFFCLTAALGRVMIASTPAPHPQRRSASASRQALGDRQIEADIRARLARGKIAADRFQVHVQGGVATLEGHTDVVQHKGVATRIAKAGGAIQVVNKIQISEAARQRAAANLERGRERAAAKRGQIRAVKVTR